MRKKEDASLDLSSREVVFGEFERIVKNFAAASLKDALESAYLYFPAMFAPDQDGTGAPPPADPTMLYLCVDLDDRTDNYPMWKTSIREIINALVCESVADGSWSEGLRQIASEFRKIANEIDEKIK